MITVIGDEQNRVIAYVEWRQVGQSGFDKLNGEYIWVNDLWIHPEYRGKGLILELTEQVMWKVPEAKFCYFTRRKYGGRIRMYTREQFESLVAKMESV